MVDTIKPEKNTGIAQLPRSGVIEVDVDLCLTCRECEVACSLYHEDECNPSLSRIRIEFDDFGSADLDRQVRAAKKQKAGKVRKKKDTREAKIQKAILEYMGYRFDLKMFRMNAGKIKEKNDPTYGFDAQEEKYCDMMEAGIIDPTKVVRIALQDAASVAGVLVTTEAIVAQVPQQVPATDAYATMAGAM